MSKQSTITSFARTMKDFYAQPGETLKQYVVDTKREMDWVAATCPRIEVPEHEHETEDGTRYTEGGSWRWDMLDENGCDYCSMLHDHATTSPEVKAWLAEKAARPPICEDREKLSDQVQPDYTLAPHPIFAMLPKVKP